MVEDVGTVEGRLYLDRLESMQHRDLTLPGSIIGYE